MGKRLGAQGAHCALAGAASWPEAVPGGHGAQVALEAAPRAALKVPARQAQAPAEAFQGKAGAPQPAAALAPAGQKKPTGQGSARSAVRQVKPAGQARQAVEPLGA